MMGSFPPGMCRIGEEQARTEQEDAEDKEWRDLLSWDGTVHTPGIPFAHAHAF